MWSLDDRLQLVPAHHDPRLPQRRQATVFRLTLASGRKVRATANHPFLTYDGWTPLGELRVGDAARRRPGTCRRRCEITPRGRTTRSSCSRTCSATARSSSGSRSATPASTRRTSRRSRRRPAHVRHHRRARRLRRRAGAPPCGCRRRTGSPTAGATRSPRGSTSSACSDCAATRSSCPTRSSACPRSRSPSSSATSGRPTGRSRSTASGRAAGSTTPRPAAGWSTTSPGCCCASASPPGSRRSRKAGYRDGYTLDIYRRGEPAALPATRSASTAQRGSQATGCSRRSCATIKANTNVDTVPREVWDRRPGGAGRDRA